jgi:hypothetical protein
LGARPVLEVVLLHAAAPEDLLERLLRPSIGRAEDEAIVDEGGADPGAGLSGLFAASGGEGDEVVAHLEMGQATRVGHRFAMAHELDRCSERGCPSSMWIYEMSKMGQGL